MNVASTSRIRSLFVCACLVGSFLLGAKQSNAQAGLDFKRIDVRWPTIELIFTVFCNGQQKSFLEKTNFKVVENGIEIGQFELWCPVDTTRCPTSTALVFDASGSMRGAPNIGAKNAGYAYVNMMDGVLDEAAVLWFNTSVTLQQGMTTSKPALIGAIDALPANGNTAIWDGAYEGVVQANKGKNPCKAVILMTDGQDNSSRRIVSEVVALAVLYKIPVYTIQLGNVPNSALLRALAEQTGGRYYKAPTPAELAAIYQEIAKLISYVPSGDCRITYIAKCMDGGLRTVDLSLLNYCNTPIVTKTRTYTAALDTSTFIPLTFRLGRNITEGASLVSIPLELLDPIFPRDILQPASFTVLFNENCMRFINMETPVGSLFSGIPFSAIPIPGGVRIQTLGRKAVEVRQPAVLAALLNFQTLDPGGRDTVCCPVRLSNWSFQSGCFRPVLQNGEICVIPTRPKLTAQCLLPDSLHFDETLGSYVPNPFPVSVSALNTGTSHVKNATAFVYLPADVAFADSGESARKTFDPSTLMTYTGGMPPTVTWNVRYTKQPRYDTYLDFRFVIGGTDASGAPVDSVTVWCRVRVPGLQPSLHCKLSMPDSLTVSSSGTVLEPNPFTISYRLWNTSIQPVRIGVVELQYAVGEQLELDPATPKIRSVNVTLRQGDTVVVTWSMNAKGMLTRRVVSIAVVAADEEGNTFRGNPPCARDLVIPNLKTALTCRMTTSEEVLRYVPSELKYEPANWIITAELVNLGGVPLTDAWIEIALTDSTLAQYIEFDPTFPDNGNPKTLLVLFPQSPRTFRWGFRLKSPNVTGAPLVPQFKVVYRTKETSAVSTGCAVDMTIEPMIYARGLDCELLAPDSIMFAVDRYDPSSFDVQVQIMNTGNVNARNLRAYLLQDTRFNILSPSILNLGLLEAGRMISFTDPGNNGFQVKVNPREADGFDTVRVLITADDFPAKLCEYPIHVQREKRPVFLMACEASPDRLSFDERSNTYVPNPFIVRTTAINIGDARAESCQLVFVGSSRFMPWDGSAIVPVGTGGEMQPGDTVRQIWNVLALRWPTGGWDTLVYQIQGRGGMESRLILGECRVPVYVPPAGNAEYRLSCSAPDTLHFDRGAGMYTPDPFPFTVRLTNEGSFDGLDIDVAPSLPKGFSFAVGETPVKRLSRLASGASTDMQWFIRPAVGPESFDRTVGLCARAVDRLERTAECCASVVLPQVTNAVLSLTCSVTPDTLIFNAQNGTYHDNPFLATARITNHGDRPAENARIALFPQSSDLLVLGDQERRVAAKLEPKTTTDTISWLVRALPRSSAGLGDLRFVVTTDAGASQQCVASIYVRETGVPDLQCAMKSSMDCTDDTLFYNYEIGDFQDCHNTMSVTRRSRVFTMTALIANRGGMAAQRVQATLLPQEGVTLDVDENATKTLGEIPINGQTEVHWRLKPVRQDGDAVRTFFLRVNADNSSRLECSRDIVVKGAPKIVHLSLPLDPVGRVGEKISVPLSVGSTLGSEIHAYKLNIQFNDKLVRFVNAFSTNTLTARTWIGPRATVYPVDRAGNASVVRVEDATTGSPLNMKAGGVLVVLVFEAKLDGVENRLVVQSDVLKFLDSFQHEGGTPMYSSMNSKDHSAGEDVHLTYADGMITVAGDCIVPLRATGRYDLSQNKPNPFNPSTTIEYEIGDENEVSLKVFDLLGREVSTLVQSRQTAGRYSVFFDGGSLASGVYIYRLTTPGYTKYLPMILAR